MSHTQINDFQVSNMTVHLNNGSKIPLIGLGTWKSSNDDVKEAVRSAIDIGYKHIDCAFIYRNEKGIGEVLREKITNKTVQRDELFITSKLWLTYFASKDVRPAFKQTLDDLGLDYVDLYLIHWPVSLFNNGKDSFALGPDGKPLGGDVHFMEAWTEMEKLVDEGLCKAIGLSNFNSKQVEEVCSKGRIKPAVNQVECHPYLNQKQLIDHCKSLGVVVCAYSPLGSADRPDNFKKSDDPVILEIPEIQEIAKKYSKTPAQVAIRYQIERGIPVIPKSTKKQRIAENFEALNFELSKEDMDVLNSFESHRLLDFHIMAHHPQYPFNEPF